MDVGGHLRGAAGPGQELGHVIAAKIAVGKSPPGRPRAVKVRSAVNSESIEVSLSTQIAS
jgi:hypothetical protein